MRTDRRPESPAGDRTPLRARAPAARLPEAREERAARPRAHRRDGPPRPARRRPARGVRRPGRRRGHHRPDRRGARLRRLQRQRGAVGISLNAAILIRHAQPEVVREWVPRMIARRGDRRDLPDRAARRLGRQQPAAEGATRRRPLRDQRREDVDHLRRPGRRLPDLRAHRQARRGRQGRQRLLHSVRGHDGHLAHAASTTSAAPSSAAARCSSTTCACRSSHRLGDEGKGFTQVMQGFDYSRALIGLQCCGAAQASLDEAWAYSRSARPSADRSGSSRA